MLPGWLPEVARGALLEGGAEEIEMQKIKTTTREGSLEQSFCHLQSTGFSLNPPERFSVFMGKIKA